MSALISWNWSDPAKQRKLITVEDHILWSYALLSVSREIMKARQKGKPHDFEGNRTKWTNVEMSRYQEKKRNISTLDRDDALAQNGIKVCAHCGTEDAELQWDHLIPRSRLSGEYIALNPVRSCPYCNTSRGNKHLMAWHRQRQTFPTLGVLRRYLKLCYFYAKTNSILNVPADKAVESGLPFDPRHFPRKFPDVSLLIWDYAHPASPRQSE